MMPPSQAWRTLLPEPEGHHIQELAHSYAQVVVNKECPLMQQGRASPRAWNLLDEMGAHRGGGPPTTDARQGLYDQALLERIHGLADARKERLLDAGEGLPNILRSC